MAKAEELKPGVEFTFEGRKYVVTGGDLNTRYNPYLVATNEHGEECGFNPADLPEIIL